jgi:hypothetical protein
VWSVCLCAPACPVCVPCVSRVCPVCVPAPPGVFLPVLYRVRVRFTAVHGEGFMVKVSPISLFMAVSQLSVCMCLMLGLACIVLYCLHSCAAYVLCVFIMKVTPQGGASS